METTQRLKRYSEKSEDKCQVSFDSNKNIPKKFNCDTGPHQSTSADCIQN